MKDMVFFVPVKWDSERLQGKNRLEISPGKPLVTLALEKGVELVGAENTYCVASDARYREYLPPGVQFCENVPENEISIHRTIWWVAQHVPAETYILHHCTAPFLSVSKMRECLDHATDCGSAMTVRTLRTFLWNDFEPMNFNPQNICRTQDMAPVHAETSGAYAYVRAWALLGRRHAFHPACVPCDLIEALDIDTPEDFELAKKAWRWTHEF